MDQQAGAQQGPAHPVDAGAHGVVSLGAVLAIVGVSLLGGLLVLVNVVLALVSTVGPDSCETISCHGDGTLVTIFFVIAVIGGIATVGTWFTGRPARRGARYVLALIAVGLPPVADLIALSNAPSWLV